MPKSFQTKDPIFCKFYLISQLSYLRYNPYRLIHQNNALTIKLSNLNMFNLFGISIECFTVSDQQNWSGIYTHLISWETDGIEKIQM